ncbi:hypothetical protein ACROYT_G015360 [Oculina patagonica]
MAQKQSDFFLSVSKRTRNENETVEQLEEKQDEKDRQEVEKGDIFQYREDVNSLEIKLLTLENVDFNLNQSGKIVKQLLPHSDSQEHQTDCNNTDATG